jgi:hypothetical protein
MIVKKKSVFLTNLLQRIFVAAAPWEYWYRKKEQRTIVTPGVYLAPLYRPHSPPFERHRIRK